MSEVFEPTEQQSDAIESIVRNRNSTAILARPGSGKTYVVATSIDSIGDDLKPHQGVVAISFTNKASDELRRRVRRREGLESSYFGTIDGFCIAEIIMPFLPHLWGLCAVQTIRRSEISQEGGGGLPDFSWLDRNTSYGVFVEHLDDVREAYELGWLILESVALLALYVVRNSGSCRRYLRVRYVIFFVDEYQDSNARQHQLLCEMRKLQIQCVAVGDPDQSIYSFRGGDPAYLTELAERGDFEMMPLEENRRCHGAIQTYAMAIFGRSRGEAPAVKRVMYKHLGGGEIRVAGFIDKVVDECRAKWPGVRTFGVLVNANHRAALIHRHLRTENRLVRTSALEEYHSGWASLFTSLLRYRYDEVALRWEIVEIFDSGKRSRRRAALLRALLGQLRKEMDLDDVRRTCVDVAQELMPNDQDEGALRALDATLADVAELGASAFWGQSDALVSVMTIHKAKGLEFDAVFQADMYEWEFPAKRPRRLSDGSLDFDDPVYKDLREDKRKHYVAVTRAKSFVYLLSSSRRTKSNNEVKMGSPSEFLSLPGLSDLRV